MPARESRDKISVITLGCPKNVVDSEKLMKQLIENNFRCSLEQKPSDVVIINTCGFIQDAKQESIDAILNAVELKKRRKIKKLIVVGCLSERYAPHLMKEIPEIDYCFGVNSLEKVLKCLGGEFKYECIGERYLTTPTHYAYLKISDGCDRLCSFCAIPLIHGKHVSRSMEEIVAEVKKLAKLGVKELNLVAQDTTYYGLDLYGKRTLSRLIETISEIDGIEWIRILYAFPTSFPLDLIDQYKNNPKVCKYLDIPIQHISDAILASMKRGITSERIKDLLSYIRDAIPDIALRTTLIVGYPLEGEKEFEDLIRFVEETQFERLGVFMYSQEEGTPAYVLGDPISKEIKQDRYNLILELQSKISLDKNKQRIGQLLKVLVDKVNGSVAIGRTEWDAPEIDNEVIIKNSGQILPGQFYDVNINKADEYLLIGKVYER